MENKDVHNFINNLVEDESFITWVKSEYTEDDEKWSVFIDDHIDQMDDINAAIHLVRSIDFVDDNTIDTKKLWQRIESDISVDTPKKVATIISLSRFRKIGLAVAACVALFIIFRPGFNSEKQIQTALGQEITEVLPDGSEILINADSKITYDAKKWESDRTVSLEGVAFFEVQKGSKFTVQTAKGRVEVLGTSFSVRQRGDVFEVICKTGKVAVTQVDDNTQIILLPGDMSTLESGKLIHKTAETDGVHKVDWIDGVYTFQNVQVAAVVDELERQYAVEVVMAEGMDTIMYTGFFNKGDLDKALYAVTWPLGLTYKIDGNKVVLSK